jgi:hypothetical protein
VQAARQFIRLFKDQDLKPGQIFGDADGLGTGFVCQMAEEGWHINRFYGGQAAKESDEYANLIGEVWHTATQAIHRGEINLGELDRLTFEQITSRKSEWNATGKLRIEDKEKMRKAGLKSPDRADALLSCITLGANHSGRMSSASVIRSPRSAFATPRAKGFNTI